MESPDKYDHIRRENDKLGSGIHVIWGVMSDGTVEMQAIRFDSSKFTAEEARKWLKDHDFKPMSFEPATGEKGKAMDGKSLSQGGEVRVPDKDARQVMNVKDARLEAKAYLGKEAKDDPGWVQGYASVWDNVDLGGEIIRKGAFTKSIQDRVKAGKVKLMATHFAHGASVLDTIGTVTEAEEDDYGLMFKAKLAGTEKAQEVRQLILEGHVTGLSVGYSPVRWNFIQMPMDQEGKDVRTIVEHVECKLYEVTVTPSPMNELAQVTTAKSLTSAAEKARDFVSKMESSGDVKAADAIREVFGDEADVETLAKSVSDLGILLNRLLGQGDKAEGTACKKVADLHLLKLEQEKRRLVLEELSL